MDQEYILQQQRVFMQRAKANNARINEFNKNLKIDPTPLKTRRNMKMIESLIIYSTWLKDSQKFASIHKDNKVSIFDMMITKQEKSYNLKDPCSMAISRVDNTILIGSNDGSIYLFNPDQKKDPEILAKNPANRSINSCCFKYSKHQFVTGDPNGLIVLWDAETAVPISTVTLKDSGSINKIIDCPALSETSGSFAIAYESGLIMLYDCHSEKIIAKYEEKKNVSCRDIKFHPSFLHIGGGFSDGKFMLYDIRADVPIIELGPSTETDLQSLRNPQINSIEFSPSGKLLFTGNENNLCHQWNLLQGFYLGNLSGHEKPLVNVEICPDLSALATTCEESIKIWA